MLRNTSTKVAKLSIIHGGNDYALSPLPVTTYDGRGPPPRPKSFDANDLRRFPSANTVPKEFQDYFIKSCSAGVDIDDIYCIMVV
jgi:hypothetical protein